MMMDPRLKWAFQQSTRQLVKLGAKFNKWRADTTVKIPELMQDLSKLTKVKWDDKVVNVVTAVIRIWKPLFKWISKQDQKIINSMDKKLAEGSAVLEDVKEAGKQYQADKRKAKELVQTQRNGKTESIATEDEEMAKRKKSKGSIPQLPKRNGFGQKVDEYGFAIGKPGKKKDDLVDDKGLPLTYQQRQMKKMKESFGVNDLEWYNNLPDLMNSVTIPNFLQNTGNIELGDNGNIASDKVGLAPIAALNLTLCKGTDSQAGITSAIKRLYTNLRRVNTGSTVYTERDLLHYVYNLRAAIAIDRYLRRAYGCINKFSPLNNRVPYAIFTAMGLDYDSFKDNMANLRLVLNNNATRLHTIMAGKCDLFERTAWLFDHIFVDGKTKKSQMYVFNPLYACYWEYSSSTWKYLQVPLTTNATTNTGRTLTQSLTYFNTLMSNIYSSDKVALISSDIIKAYGIAQADNYFDIIPEDYQVKEVYSEEVLVQIQNAVIIGDDTSNISSTTDEETFVLNTSLISTSLGTPTVVEEHFGNPIINTYKDTINVLEYAEHTRFVAAGNTTNSSNNLILSTYGSEVVNNIMFAVYVPSNTLNVFSAINPYKLSRLIYSPRETLLFGGDTTIRGSMLRFALWSYFDWMPAFRPLIAGYYPSGQSSYSYTQVANLPLIDLDNFYFNSDLGVLDNVHNVVMQSLLYWSDVIRDVRVSSI